MKRLLALLSLSTCALFAQTITAVQNNYGRTASTDANYGIAEGSIFIVKGTGFYVDAANPQTLQNAPLLTTLFKVRVRITVGSTVTYAPIYYVLGTQIAAILPSSIPVGNATVIIENNGVATAPFTFKVVKSAFGMLAWDFENATGRAIVVRYPSGTLAGLSASGSTNALNSNDVVLLYGSGLGPTTGDESQNPTSFPDMTGIPITITIGGANATVAYHGRSTFTGLDQITVVIPVLTTYSCDVPMIITTNGVQANATTIPVAQTGSTCTPANNGGGGGGNGGGSASYPTLSQSQINAIAGRGVYKSGSLDLTRSRTFSLTTGTSTSTDSFDGSFTAVTGTSSVLTNYLTNFGFTAGFTAPANGVCNVFNGFAPPLLTGVTSTSLNAGASITAQGPPGPKVMPRADDGNGGFSYSAAVTSPAAAGNYSFNNGGGGPDVGGFNISVTVGAELQWTNRASITQVNRSGSLTVTWQGGQPGSLVALEGLSIQASITGGSPTGFGFICWANQSAGQLTVPSSILTQLPATTNVGGVNISPGALVLIGNDNYATTTVSGLDFLTATSSTNITQSGVVYK